MGKESLNGQMELSIQVIGRRTQQMVMENTTGLIEDVTWENGEIINFMEKVCIHGQMDDHTMAHTLMIKRKGMALIFGPMVENLKDTGRMESNMEKAKYRIKIVYLAVGFGKMV